MPSISRTAAFGFGLLIAAAATAGAWPSYHSESVVQSYQNQSCDSSQLYSDAVYYYLAARSGPASAQLHP